MKNLIAAASCWLLKNSFSAMDIFYASLAALTASDYGFWSVEFLIASIMILVFHFMFCRMTLRIRMIYLFNKMVKLCGGKIDG